MPAVDPLEPTDPPSIGAHRLTGRLGQGGQGIVYLAEDEAGGQVAIKLFQVPLDSDPALRKGIIRELETAKQVARFCTAQVLDSGVLGNRPYIISEYVPGPSLQQVVTDEGPVSGSSLDRLAIGTATALVSLHDAGIIHCDFKPGNVLLGPDGWRVIDFGISRMSTGSQTLASRVTGTPAFMAPEQLAGEQLGPAVDVFAWASTMAFASAGAPPFGNDTIPAVMNRISHLEPDLSRVEEPLRGLLTECLAKSPAERPSAQRILDRLVRRSGTVADLPAPGGAGNGPDDGPGNGFVFVPGVGFVPGDGFSPGGAPSPATERATDPAAGFFPADAPAPMPEPAAAAGVPGPVSTGVPPSAGVSSAGPSSRGETLHGPVPLLATGPDRPTEPHQHSPHPAGAVPPAATRGSRAALAAGIAAALVAVSVTAAWLLPSPGSAEKAAGGESSVASPATGLAASSTPRPTRTTRRSVRPSPGRSTPGVTPSAGRSGAPGASRSPAKPAVSAAPRRVELGPGHFTDYCKTLGWEWVDWRDTPKPGAYCVKNSGATMYLTAEQRDAGCRWRFDNPRARHYFNGKKNHCYAYQ